jgi:hypothetical protein
MRGYLPPCLPCCVILRYASTLRNHVNCMVSWNGPEIKPQS